MRNKVTFDEEREILEGIGGKVETSGWKEVHVEIQGGATIMQEKDREKVGFFRDLKTLSARVLKVVEKEEELKINLLVVEGFEMLAQLTIEGEGKDTRKVVVKVLEL